VFTCEIFARQGLEASGRCGSVRDLQLARLRALPNTGGGPVTRCQAKQHGGCARECTVLVVHLSMAACLSTIAKGSPRWSDD